MGEVYGFRKRMSAIALLDVSAVQDVMQTMLRLADEGRLSWVAKNPERCVAAAAAAVAREAAVALGAAGPSRAGSTTAEVAPAAGLSVRVS
jgi:hypothetical protein